MGCDEAGRGCLAGPVFAAAVILDPKRKNSQLDDSKKLSKNTRAKLRNWIETNALDYAVASLSPKEIDEYNILYASFRAMHKAIDRLETAFDSLLIDGNRFIQYQTVSHHCIVKGDARFKSIAAASILAKTYRDEYMEQLAKDFPCYQWERNYGYPTKTHREAIKIHGPCIHHRQSFQLLPKQIKLEL